MNGMNIILLSGGSGKRLWPLSNEIRSKQFIKMFRGENGEYTSMVQRVYGQIRAVDPDAVVTVATSRSQVSALHNQLGTDIGISVEPCRRDTFPAIALAAAYLKDVKGVSPEDPVVVCPVDPYVDRDYFEMLKSLSRQAASGAANLVLMGIEPTYPSEKYGYILPTGKTDPSTVSAFREKPDAETARGYIARGALWNGGVFAFRLRYVLDKAEELLGLSGYDELLSRYETLPKVSFDYAVAEKEPHIQVMRFAGAWKDIGTWNTLAETMEEKAVGKAVLHESCENVHVINELGVPVVVMGLRDAVVAASPEGVLVSSLDQSSYIKPIVDHIDQQIRFAEKSWGNFTVLDAAPDSMTIKVDLLPGHRLHYHSHAHRDETWTVVSGEGIAVVDDAEVSMKPGTMLRLPAGCRHTVIAHTAMTIIEVQVGQDISAHDKTKYSLKDRYGEHK